MPLRVLFVEDNPDDVFLVLSELRHCGYDVPDTHWKQVQTAESLVAALLPDAPWDLIISDFSMPTFTGPEALAVCSARGVEIPFIIVSGTVGEEQSVAALRAGARDFISKGKLARLGPAVARELKDYSDRAARRKAEQQLLQAQKMNAIGQLAGGVAHDLNNILGVIMGQAELLARHIEASDPRLRRVIGIREATDRGAVLVRQLLTFSRREVVQRSVVHLNPVVTETVRMLERIVGEEVTIKCHLAEGLWPVSADTSQLEQVVMNLVINARDAMPQGGNLVIETRNRALVDSTIPPPGDYVQLDIKDSGHGMDEATAARIFEPFFTTKEPGKGTGLGLATVYGIVTQAAGHIEVHSIVGQGTTFRIYLPRTERTAMATPEKRVDAGATGHETILLLEDDLPLRLLIHESLEDAGYRVLAADSPERAIEIATSYSKEIQLFLTDVVLPGMRGPAVAAKVSALRPKTKVLFMSGYSMPERGGHAQIAPLVVKPFTGDGLRIAIRRLLDVAEVAREVS